MSYPSIWFQGMKEDDKQKLIHSLKSSDLSQRLQSILEDWERQLEPTIKDYESPSWAYKQAHRNGMLEVYKKLRSLFDHKEA